MRKRNPRWQAGQKLGQKRAATFFKALESGSAGKRVRSFVYPVMSGASSRLDVAADDQDSFRPPQISPTAAPAVSTMESTRLAFDGRVTAPSGTEAGPVGAGLPTRGDLWIALATTV